MAEDDEKPPPSLEPPSLFGRKKRKQAVAPTAPAAPTASAAPAAPAAQPETDADIRPEVEPVPPPPEVDQSPTTILDADRPPRPTRPPPPPPPAARPLYADEQVTRPVPQVQPAPAVPKPPRKPSGKPWVGGRAAAVITGLVVGGLIVAATWGGLQLCTEVKGTNSCGSAGFPLLVAILIVAGVLGALLLRAARVPEPGSTSFLAVGLTSVVALLFLVDQLFEWWMAIVIPLVSVLTYLLSHWVTTTYIEPAMEETVGDEDSEVHDIR